MTATSLYRVAAVIFVLFATGHTIGFLRFTPPTAEGVAVRESMRGVEFKVAGRSLTYAGFYNGFGLFVTAYMLFSAFLAMHMGGLARTAPQAIAPIGWAFFVTQAVTLALSAKYFAPPPTVFSAALTAIVGAAAWLVQRAV